LAALENRTAATMTTITMMAIATAGLTDFFTRCHLLAVYDSLETAALPRALFFRFATSPCCPSDGRLGVIA